MSSKSIPSLSLKQVENAAYGRKSVFELYRTGTIVYKDITYIIGVELGEEGRKDICVALREDELGKLLSNNIMKREGA